MKKDYIEIEVFVSTGLVGSKRSRTIKFYDSEFDGMNDKDKEDYIEEICSETMFEMIDWGYEINE